MVVPFSPGPDIFSQYRAIVRQGKDIVGAISPTPPINNFKFEHTNSNDIVSSIACATNHPRAKNKQKEEEQR
jgi:hypothetical protein